MYLGGRALQGFVIVKFEKGKQKIGKLERPQLWFGNGMPKVLFFTVYISETDN